MSAADGCFYQKQYEDGWVIRAPSAICWTPEELAQIGEAVRAFQAQLPAGVHRELVRIEDLSVLSGLPRG